ncbi:MAG: hypothetical protein QI199_08815 [Candidatus Korarchaeota archaeon]|nr:hypothetical protein [Candidatus Korarchaeota archaeon]
MTRLPERMEEVWILTARGLSEADAARKLGMTRQAVNKMVKEARARLAHWFVESAEFLNSDLIRLDSVRGFTVLRSRQLGLRIYVIYVPKKGLRAVFGIEPLCPGKDSERHCREIARAAMELGLVDEFNSDEEVIRRLIRLMES